MSATGKNWSKENQARLLQAVDGQLRSIARRYMRGERLDHTLQPTALMHEAYLRLFPGRESTWTDHTHFVRCAAIAMRQVLIDHARRRVRVKRGGGEFDRVPLESNAPSTADEGPETLLALEQLLLRLHGMDPRLAEIVDLLYFAGMTQDEVAKVLDLSPRTVNREWRTARAWLQQEWTRERNP